MGTSKRKVARSEARAQEAPGAPDDMERVVEEETGGTPISRDGGGLDFPGLDRTRLAERIEPDEVNGWARQLGVSPERLREAIRVAGDTLEDVRRYLTKPH